VIYIDTSALAKLVVPEPESESLGAYLSEAPGIVTSALTAIELKRAVRRHQPARLVAAEGLLLTIATIELSREVLRTAGSLAPAALRTLDAIHLASALLVRDELDMFVAYDSRLLDAATAAGIPTASPGA
jgi:predicted nucleic acid-binding protein